MAKTLANLRAIARHALGGKAAPATLGSAALTETDYVNQAGAHLCNMHEWNWLARASTTLTLTASQSTITLPATLMEVLAIEYLDTSVRVKLVSSEEFERRKLDTQNPTGVLYAAVYFPTRASVTDVPGAPILEVTPTPEETVSGALTLRYRMEWTALSSDTDKANVPAFIEPLLEEIIRAIAKGREDDSADARLAAIAKGATFQAAVRRDSRHQTDHGEIDNGIWVSAPVDVDQPIADPS